MCVAVGSNLNIPGAAFVSSEELTPDQHFFLIRPDQTFDQQKQENQHGNSRCKCQAGKGHGKRQQEDRFDIENQKNDCVQVVAGMELNPGIARRFQTAFVN